MPTSHWHDATLVPCLCHSLLVRAVPWWALGCFSLMDFAGKDLFSESQLAGIEKFWGLGQLPKPHTSCKDGGLCLSGPMDNRLPSTDSPSVHFLRNRTHLLFLFNGSFPFLLNFTNLNTLGRRILDPSWLCCLNPSLGTWASLVLILLETYTQWKYSSGMKGCQDIFSWRKTKKRYYQPYPKTMSKRVP